MVEKSNHIDMHCWRYVLRVGSSGVKPKRVAAFLNKTVYTSLNTKTKQKHACCFYKTWLQGNMFLVPVQRRRENTGLLPTRYGPPVAHVLQWLEGAIDRAAKRAIKPAIARQSRARN